MEWRAASHWISQKTAGCWQEHQTSVVAGAPHDCTCPAPGPEKHPSSCRHIPAPYLQPCLHRELIWGSRGQDQSGAITWQLPGVSNTLWQSSWPHLERRNQHEMVAGNFGSTHILGPQKATWMCRAEPEGHLWPGDSAGAGEEAEV